MADTRPLPVAALLFDERNPRLSEPHGEQPATLRALAKLQGSKLRVLAADILKEGLDPGDSFMVTGEGAPGDSFIALDGNRRLSAIRALEDPESIAGAASDDVVAALRGMSIEYLKAPIVQVVCTVFDTRAEARHWIELRHTGQRRGAGAVLWRSDESARFLATTVRPAIDTQALDFLQRLGSISVDFRSTVPTTTLRRLLSTPYVRSKIGIDWVAGELKIIGEEAQVAAALLLVVRDITNGGLKVSDLYTVGDRRMYIDQLNAPATPTPGSPAPAVSETARRTPGSEPDEAAVAPAAPVTPAAQPTQAPPTGSGPTPRGRIMPARERLIPGNCVLNITDIRIRNIERELRRLDLESAPNALGVLFRVFVELGADAYIQRRKLPTAERASLATKINDVTSDLVSRGVITDQEAVPARRASQKDSLLLPGVTLMNGWVHNFHVAPSPADLRTAWDNLQQWLVALWSP